MGDPSEDDVPTLTSAADESSPADADDRTIQETPDGEPEDPTTAIAKPPAAAAVDAEDSITATAPRVEGASIPLSPPKIVEMRTVDEAEDEDEDADQTELRTAVGASGLPNVATEADAPDDSVTQLAPATAARAESAGVIRISPKSLMPAAGASTDAYDDDSVTSRGPAVDRSAYEDDSVTTQAPAASANKIRLPPAIDGETEGTTKKVRKGSSALGAEDAESITNPAPGHLTNMLRVIAADKGAADDDDDAAQAHTQVMANAPLKPSDLGAAVAPQLEPSSESGLRVAKPEPARADRASLGPFAAARREQVTRAPTPFVPSDYDAEKKPPYALLVGIVAAISIAIPALLFVVLNQGTGELVPRIATQPSPDPVGRADAPRARAKPGASTSASAPKRPPLRR